MKDDKQYFIALFWLFRMRTLWCSMDIQLIYGVFADLQLWLECDYIHAGWAVEPAKPSSSYRPHADCRLPIWQASSAVCMEHQVLTLGYDWSFLRAVSLALSAFASHCSSITKMLDLQVVTPGTATTQHWAVCLARLEIMTDSNPWGSCLTPQERCED